MHHFGKGLVETPGNFGRQGAQPSHPELLDWLAVDFIENGWKIKRLHKMIMMSTAYRQASVSAHGGASTAAEKVDPSNRLLWKMNLRRLDAEIIRDSVLKVSGKLDTKLGGPPVWLDWNKDGLATASGHGPTEESIWRRSLYLLVRRNYSLSFLDVFDFPIMSLNCTERSSSSTPLQSLALLNSEFLIERARDLAVRVKDLSAGRPDPAKQIETAYQLALARNPTAAEMDFLQTYLREQRQLYVNLNSSHEQASDEALASLCQMLMASNEFLYVD
jgi:hypothetical protein